MQGNVQNVPPMLRLFSSETLNLGGQFCKMPTFKLYIEKRKANKLGEAPIYLRIIKDRQKSLIAMGYKVKPDDWDDEKQRVRKSHPNSVRMNNLLAQKMAEVQGEAVKMEAEDKTANTKSLKRAARGTKGHSFLKYADRYLEELEHKAKTGTLDKAKAVIAKIRAYLGPKDLVFDEITVNWLKEFEHYLRTNLGNTTNTIHGNYKIIRRLMNEAVNEDLLPFEKNPFLRYKMKTEKTNIEYLTDEELTAIETLELPAGSKLDIHRDMYVFACYTGGIRISDILQLRWRHFDGERISIHMQKTGNPLSVKVPNTGLAILHKYQNHESDKEDFIFPILRNDTDYSDPNFLFKAISSATAYTNANLKVIAKQAGITKRLHFHTSRHTFATRALRKGMRMEYASKIMGHSNLKTTQIYAKIINEELEKAMNVFN